jgi:hypothetical protein
LVPGDCIDLILETPHKLAQGVSLYCSSDILNLLGIEEQSQSGIDCLYIFRPANDQAHAFVALLVAYIEIVLKLSPDSLELFKLVII